MENKIKLLGGLFKPGDRILVAFSGGVDSTFLLYSLSVKFNLDVTGLSIKTPYIPVWEIEEAASFCKEYGIEHKIVELTFHQSLINNPGDRCYRCKKILFSMIKEHAKANNYNIIADGSNADDLSDHRPGMKALDELMIRSPLIESGITKAEIRKQLKIWGLEIWNKPAYACLLTRIPHDTRVDERMLYIIEEAEVFISRLGFPGTRVRLHKDIARLECNPGDIVRLSNPQLREKIIRGLKSLGIKYVTLDLEGYRTGSMNITDTEQ